MRHHSITVSFAFANKEEFRELQTKFAAQNYDDLIDAHEKHHMRLNENIKFQKKEDADHDNW